MEKPSIQLVLRFDSDATLYSRIIDRIDATNRIRSVKSDSAYQNSRQNDFYLITFCSLLP